MAQEGPFALLSPVTVYALLKFGWFRLFTEKGPLPFPLRNLVCVCVGRGERGMKFGIEGSTMPNEGGKTGQQRRRRRSTYALRISQQCVESFCKRSCAKWENKGTSINGQLSQDVRTSHTRTAPFQQRRMICQLTLFA